MTRDAVVAKTSGADVVEARLDLLWTTEHKVEPKSSSDEKRNGNDTGVEVEIRQLDLDAVDLDSALSTIVESFDLQLVMT